MIRTSFYLDEELEETRGNRNPYIEEEQTTQRSKEKVQEEKQRSTKHTHKTKHRITRTPLKTRGELRCSGRLSSSCSTSGKLWKTPINPKQK
jgi:isoaspartyl peptidase/L-asparaginase-like protein (Ntn-hydrolase superfamily)